MSYPRLPIGPADVTKPLTPRESEVLHLLTQGLTIKEAATSMGISWKTADIHKVNAFNKIGIRSRFDLLKRAASGPLQVVGNSRYDDFNQILQQLRSIEEKQDKILFSLCSNGKL